MSEIAAQDEIVVDIRSNDEAEAKPLHIDNVEVIHIPFYKLSTQFAELGKDKTYMLYCDRGVMSRLQALYLHEQGYTNVKVYRP